jgi:cephalosporin-C deacetylase-like acetyl esterase
MHQGMTMERRTFLHGAALAALGAAGRAAEEDPAFDPGQWLRRRKQGRLTVRTPQSGKPLQPLAAKSLKEWEKERPLYEGALRELIGPWPEKRPDLKARVLEEEKAERWTRYKVGFQSLPSSSAVASEVRAWLFVPRKREGKLPALVTLHQTVPQGKDEPAGVKGPHPWIYFARYYAERGYVTLAPDMVGYGERTKGGYARTGFEYADAFPILDAHPEMTLLGLMLFDVTRAVDYLQERPEVDAKRIGVLGHSQGGILTNVVLGLEPRLRVGVASCGYGLFRKDKLFPERWAAKNSAYLPRLHLYREDREALPLDFLQIMALAAPRPHLVQTALGDSIWTKPAVGEDNFVADELRRARSLYSKEAADGFVSVQPAGGAKDRDHGWYPECQKAADTLLEKVLLG